MLLQIYQDYSLELFICSIVCLLTYYFILYPFVLSPLKHVPGPYLHRISVIPNLFGEQSHRWVQKVHDLHAKYGDVVILSPYLVSFNDTKHAQEIYTKNLPKSDFYANFSNHGKPNIFATLGNQDHLTLKKTIMGLYSKTAIFNNCQELLEEKVTNMMTCIEGSENSKESFIEKVQTKGLEVYSLFLALAMDVVTLFELGAKNGSNYLLKEEERSIIIKHRMVSSMGFWTTRAPRFWNWAASPSILKAADELENWQLKMYEDAELSKTQDCTLAVLNSYGITGKSAYSLLSDNIFAGHETTAVQLTYLTYEVLRACNANIQEKLQKELYEAFGDPQDTLIRDLTTVDKLPYLNAVLLETLRVHSAIPGSEPRVTDKPFMVAIGEKNPCTISLPIGTVVSCQPFSLHRNNHVFPKPDVFIPERWLKYEEELEEAFTARLKKQHRYMMAFGKGIRMCLGMNLALIEMKLAVANIYWKYNSTISREWCDVLGDASTIGLCTEENELNSENDLDKMKMLDSYTTRPLRDECWLQWSRR